jgi:hypothetical protein
MPSLDVQQAAAWQVRSQQIQARCGQHRDGQLREAMVLQQQMQAPVQQTVQADERRRDHQRCPLLQAVLDTRDGRLWTNVVNAVPPPPGVHGRPEMTLRWRFAAP